MKRVSFINTALILISALSSGCIHTYPEGEGINPSKCNVVLELELQQLWESRAEYQNNRRIIVAIENEGGEIITDKTFVTPRELEDGILRFPSFFTLRASKYKIAVWSDEEDPDSPGSYPYDAAALSAIKESFSHGDRCESHYPLSGSRTMDLTGNTFVSSNSNIIVPVTLSHNRARYRLVAEDYDRFMALTGTERSKGVRYSVEICYDSPIPLVYSLIDDKAMNPAERISFSTPLSGVSADGNGATIASDCLFSPATGMTQLISVRVLDNTGQLVSDVADIEVPLERGKITTLKGNFLTNFISGGLRIDSEWNGEIIIEI